MATTSMTPSPSTTRCAGTCHFILSTKSSPTWNGCWRPCSGASTGPRPTRQTVTSTNSPSYHEDMHTEAYTYSRQTLNYPKPTFAVAAGGPPADADAGPLADDTEVSGGTLMMGSARDAHFVYDNEKWANPVAIEPFRIARAPVTNAEFAEFVDDGGYARRELWDDNGWPGARRTAPTIPSTGRRKAPAIGLYASSTRSCPFPPIVRSSTSAGSRPALIAAGRPPSADRTRVGSRGHRRDRRRGPGTRRGQTHLSLGRRGAGREQGQHGWPGARLRRRRRLRRGRQRPSDAARCWATCGSGQPPHSAPILDFPRTPTRSTPSRYSARQGLAGRKLDDPGTHAERQVPQLFSASSPRRLRRVPDLRGVSPSRMP